MQSLTILIKTLKRLDCSSKVFAIISINGVGIVKFLFAGLQLAERPEVFIIGDER